MNNKTWRSFGAILCFLILAHASNVSAANKTKVWIGAGLMAGGVGLGAHAVSRAAFCGNFDIFPYGNHVSNDDCGQDTEMIAGLALIGTGTFFLIKGILEDGSGNETRKQINPLNQKVSIGLGPTKKGWAGAVRIRW